MPIEIISGDEHIQLTIACTLLEPDERYTLDIDGSTFVYSRAGNPALQRVERQRAGGLTRSVTAQRDALLLAHLHDWANVIAQGKEIKFDRKIIPLLPQRVKRALTIDAFGAACPPLSNPTEYSVTLHRLSTDETAALAATHTTRGVLDTYGYMMALLVEGVDHVDPWGDGIAEFVKALPQDTAGLLIEAINATSRAEAEELGN